MISKSGMKQAESGVKTLSSYMIPAVAGISGFYAGDFLGIEGIISDLITTSGISDTVSVVDTLPIGGFIAAGVYFGAGSIVGSVKLSGYGNYIPVAGSWFLYGTGARTLITSFVSTTDALKTSTAGGV